MGNINELNENKNLQQQNSQNPYLQPAGPSVNQQPNNINNTNQQPNLSYQSLQDNQKQFQNSQNSSPQNNIPLPQYNPQYNIPLNNIPLNNMAQSNIPQMNIPQNNPPGFTQQNSMPQNNIPHNIPQNNRSQYNLPQYVLPQYSSSQNSQPPLNQPPLYQYPQPYQPPYNGQNTYRQPDMQYRQPYMHYPQTKNDNGLAVASMICGISSLILICNFWLISLIAAIVGLVLGIISVKNNYRNKGMAIAGIATSSVTIVCTLLIIAGCSFLSFSLLNEMNQVNDNYV